MWIILSFIEVLLRLPAYCHRSLAACLRQHRTRVTTRKASWSRTR